MNRIFLCLGLLLAFACNQNKAPETTTPAEPKELGSGIDKQYFNEDVRPQDDIFRHVNGKWLDTAEIPADKTSYGAFVTLADKSREDIKSIVDELEGQTFEKGTVKQKIADFYTSYLNEEAINAQGLGPLQAELDKISGIENQEQLAKHFANAIKINSNAPFIIFIRADQKDSNQNAVYIHHAGIGLPDRDYYFNEGEKFDTYRSAYKAYISTLLGLSGTEDATAAADAIFALESKLAEGHWTRVQNRDRNKTYNPTSVADIKKIAFPWDAYFGSFEASMPESLIVRQPDYLEHMAKVVASTDLSTWKSFLQFHLLDTYAAYLPKAYEEASFEFRMKTLRGAEEQQPRWERAVDNMNRLLGEALGQIYVEKFFKPEAKQRMEDLVGNLKIAFKERIDGLEWMTPETKVKAQEKLTKFGTKIGYPDEWKDYSKLEITADSLVQNMMNATLFNYNEQMEKLGKPVDKSEWFMPPQQVNAYYSPNYNEIVFPAAILQPPFFNLEADDAVNYGAIGGVIGHEISHGFDDQGRKSDGDGNLVDWWQDKDAEEFNARAQQLVEQYNKYEALPDTFVNGELTLGENIGDLGGLIVALKAYENSLGGKEAPVIDGFTGVQRVFLGWAQVWRIKYREEALRNRLLTDSHSPGEFRVLGVFPNIDEFYEAFDVKEGDKMYIAPEDRVRIW